MGNKLYAKSDPMVCPICKGKGEIKQPQRIMGKAEIKERAVKILRKAGFSYREIMVFTDYKSPRSIGEILKK